MLLLRQVQTLGSSTAANSVLIQNGAAAGTQVTSIANGVCAANSTVNVLGGASSAGVFQFNVLNGVLGAGVTSATVNILNGNAAAGATLTFNVLGSVAATQLGTINLGTGAVAHVVNIGSSSAGAVGILSGSTITVTGTTNINATGAAVTTVGTGGTGATHIGNATGNTAVTGSLTASTTLTATLGAITATNGNLNLAHTGNKLLMHASTAASDAIGVTSRMTAGSITVSTTAVTASSIIFLTAVTPAESRSSFIWNNYGRNKFCDHLWKLIRYKFSAYLISIKGNKMKFLHISKNWKNGSWHYLT